MTKYALLIGINYKGKKFALKGCINDIYAINIIYVMNISYHHTNIKLLEANPTA
jgi:hypothetical protein